MKRRIFLKTTALAAAAGVALLSAAHAENAKLKVGFVGVTSGPAAAWGISNQRSMETRAAWLNEPPTVCDHISVASVSKLSTLPRPWRTRVANA